jgi:hypothetical protein
MKLTMIIFILVANIADAFLTNFGISSGQMTEGNPIMSWLYHQNVVIFILVKISLPILLACILLYFVPKKPSFTIRSLLITTSCIYVYVIALHGAWLTNII